MKPAIVGIGGLELAPDEAALFRAMEPAGVILFARNVDHPLQLTTLMLQLRGVLPLGAVIMVDQEGGRVARLRPPHWRAHPPARALGSKRAAWLTGALIGLDCARAGFDVVAAPVLDVPVPGADDVIGDRAFSSDPNAVAELGAAFASGLLAAGIQPVGKHAPGHGRAMADSHLVLPSLEGVSDNDVLPFIRNRGLPWLMTAHIRYMNLDAENPATQSASVIGGTIRAAGAIGFSGVLVTDDLSMGALHGTPGERAIRALHAGCDIVLHCSGQLEDTRAILDAVPDAQDVCLDRLAGARAMAAGARERLDEAALASERAALLA